MSRPLRLEHEGAIWHITSRGNDRRKLFRQPSDYQFFLALLAKVVKRFHWLLHEYTLMGNHYHLVIETPEKTLSRGMQYLNGQYARYFNRKYGHVGHVFQGRFHAVLVESQSYLNEVRRYTVLNPVRAGMVADPGKYRWSSYRAHAGLETMPEWLYSDWLFELDREPARCQEIYRQYVGEKVGAVDSPFEHVVGQIYLGREAWVAKMRKVIESEPRSEEHPKAQRLIPRVKMPKVVEAVAAACEMEESEVREGHGGAARMMAAWIGWNEGMMKLREIAAELRLRSAGYISTLIRAAAAEMERDHAMQRLARDAITRLQRV